jgi:hypothetical protein
MPQPNFDGPAIAGPSRVNWQERLEQGFQSRHVQRLQNRGGRRREQNEEMPAVAGPSTEGRVDWQGRLEQDFQARHNQRLRNHGRPLQDQNPGVFIAPQQFAGQQERYVEEERQHAAHLAELQRQ